MPRLVKVFASRQQTRVLELLLEHPGRVFTQSSLARELGCSSSTVSRVLAPLVSEGVARAETVGGQMKIVALNQESEAARLLLDFHKRFRSL